MKTIALDSTKSIKLTITTGSSIDYVCIYGDNNTSTGVFTEGSSASSLTSGSVTIVSSPSSGTIRLVSEISLKNQSTGTDHFQLDLMTSGSITGIYESDLYTKNNFSLSDKMTGGIASSSGGHTIQKSSASLIAQPSLNFVNGSVINNSSASSTDVYTTWINGSYNNNEIGILSGCSVTTSGSLLSNLAPSSASYVVLGNNSTLSNGGFVLTQGSNITVTTSTSASTVTIASTATGGGVGVLQVQIFS